MLPAPTLVSLHHVYVPVPAVKAIYAFENGRGMVFSDDEGEGEPSPTESTSYVKKGRPNLKVVK